MMQSDCGESRQLLQLLGLIDIGDACLDVTRPPVVSLVDVE